MKPLAFVGTSLDDLREFPAAARSEVGYQLDRVQQGLDPRGFQAHAHYWQRRLGDQGQG